MPCWFSELRRVPSPTPVPGLLVSRNRACVAVGSVADVDAETDLAVGRIGSLATDDPIVFDGLVDYLVVEAL
jgi:hypothetical protein